MLDKQINLFKVDTNAFLTEEEKEHRKYLVKLKKVREKIKKRLPKYNNKDNEPEKKIIKKKLEQGKPITKYENWFLIFTDIISQEEKNGKIIFYKVQKLLLNTIIHILRSIYVP